MGPRAGLDRCGKSGPHRDSVPDCPARSQSLYRLSYPAHFKQALLFCKTSVNVRRKSKQRKEISYAISVEGQRICSKLMMSASFREVTKTCPRKYCSLQAEAARAGLKIKSKETSQLRINLEVTTNTRLIKKVSTG